MQTTFKYRIEYDQDAESPRDWCNAGKMICWHRHYNLGDDHKFSDPDSFFLDLLNKYGNETAYFEGKRTTYEELPTEELFRRAQKENFILPIYLYDHSGITINTTGFSCGWDSGQVGFIYISHKDAKKEYGKRWKDGKKWLSGEVEAYDQFLTGEVFGYVVFEEDEDGEIVEDHVDSCWGFFGRDYCEEQAKEAAENCEKERTKKEAEEIYQAQLCLELMHV